MRRTRSDAIRVGLFVLVAGAMLVGGLLWIAGSRFFRPVDTYTVLFEQSVSGLNAGSNVEYQGVVVGRVRDMQLTRDIPPKVAVIVDIEPGTPVRTDTVAALLGSFVTGIKFIQLQGGSAAALPLGRGGTIRGDVTSLEQFRDRVTEIADRATTILRNFEENVFTPDNGRKLQEFIDNLGNIARGLSRTMETLRAEETGKDIAELVDQVSALARNLNAVIDDFYGRRERIFGSLESTLRHVDEAVTDTRDLVRGTQSQVTGAGGSLGSLVTDLKAATDRLQETIDVIRSDPSILLWGRSVPEREFER
jgi:phospholipid/cholesterol/gamma-HCH transport system substrate-binding protein